MIVYKIAYLSANKFLFEDFNQLLSRLDDSDHAVAKLGEALGLADAVPDDGEYYTFMLPTPTGIEIGFLWDHEAHTYIASPMPLPWLEVMQNIGKPESAAEREHRQTTSAPPKRASSRVDLGIKWTESRSGNPTASHKGIRVTVFANRRGGGFAGILSGAGESKKYTNTFPTIEEVKEDIEDHFSDYRDQME